MCAQSECERATSSSGVVPFRPCICCRSFLFRRRSDLGALCALQSCRLGVINHHKHTQPAVGQLVNQPAEQL